MNPTDNMDAQYIGDHIRALRTTRGWTQEEMAVRLNIAQRTLSLIEGGHRQPSLPIILRLCDMLSVPVSAVLPPRVCDDAILPSAYYGLPDHVQASVRAAIDAAVNLAITAAGKNSA